MSFARLRIIVIVITVSALIALVNSIQFFAALFQQPPNTVYLGTTHYYEDYFFYLNHFFQGAHGAWLTVSRYTSEATSPSIIYWSNILMGKIGGLVGLSPILSYNLAVLFLAFGTIFASYFVILRVLGDSQKAFIGFLFTNLATSQMNHIYVDGNPMWYPFQLWRTPHFTFDRLGSVPHQLFQTLLFYLLFLTYFSINSKIKWTSIALAVLLTTINPVTALVFLIFAWLMAVPKFISFAPLSGAKLNEATSHERPGLAWLIPTFLLTGVTVITYIYVSGILNTLPHLQSKLWEASQQSTTQWWFLLLSIGPIVPFFFTGVYPVLKKLDEKKLFALSLPIVCYLLFMSPIPKAIGFSNARIIFPALYAFIGAVAAEGLYWLATVFARFGKLSYRLTVLTVFTLFLFLSIFTLQWEIREKAKVTENLKIPFIYMPTEMYQGFQELAKKRPFNDVVLANPVSHIDILVPALTGHTTYSGHFLTTINNSEKVETGRKFYTFSFSPSEAKQWLTEKSIHYIVFTSHDGNRKKFETYYPFLRREYANDLIAFYSW